MEHINNIINNGGQFQENQNHFFFLQAKKLSDILSVEDCVPEREEIEE